MASLGIDVSLSFSKPGFGSTGSPTLAAPVRGIFRGDLKQAGMNVDGLRQNSMIAMFNESASCSNGTID